VPAGDGNIIAISFHRPASLQEPQSQKEIHPHNFSYFVGEPPSVAQGGRGIVVPGRSARRKRFNTVSEFAEHLANDAMPSCATNKNEPQHFPEFGTATIQHMQI
jgi:hypothetical protein